MLSAWTELLLVRPAFAVLFSEGSESVCANTEGITHTVARSDIRLSCYRSVQSGQLVVEPPASILPFFYRNLIAYY